jgi:hypothetical protein
MASTRRSSGTEGAAGVSDTITIALIPKVAGELQKLQKRTGLSKTDLVNRAISLYEFIDEQQSAGRELLVIDSDSGETQVIRFL